MKRFLRFLTEHWTPREAALTVLVIILAAFLVATLRDSPFGGLAVFLMLIVQGFMWYSTGRNHQVHEDYDVLNAAQNISLETRKMLLESYIFEMWWTDMRRDAKHNQILIQSRVSLN